MAQSTVNELSSIIPSDQFDRDVLRLVNKERRQRGLQTLTLSEKLDEAADLHSQDMADNNYFDHTGQNGSNPGTRIEQAEYTDWNRWGENINWYRGTAAEVVQSWMESSGHRANILNRDFTYMGVGYAFNDNSEGDHRWTQVFAEGSSNPGQYVAQTTAATTGSQGNDSLTEGDRKFETIEFLIIMGGDLNGHNPMAPVLRLISPMPWLIILS